jgi:hypothetical protein
VTVKQIAVRLPRLLDQDLNEVRRLRPRAQSIELNITPLSVASLTLDDGSGVGIRSFVELYNAKGSVGVYRVSAPEESYGGGERVTLEHGICVLDDAVVPGQGEITGTPTSVLTQILEHQTTKARGAHMWSLGTVEAPSTLTITVEHDGTKTLEMLMKAVGELDGYMLSFDQSGFPWIVNVVKKPESVACEGRLSRNIRTIRKTLDDSDLCTRLYCELLEGGYIESNTINAWGVVEKSITLNDDMPKGEADAYCRRYLDNRKNPTLAVEMDATEWFVMTGERLDRFEVGDLCRIALPEYGVVIEERIVAMRYTDAIGMPEAVTVSLANQITDLSIKTAETKRDVDGLKYTSTAYGNRIARNENNITNLKVSQEGLKSVSDKMVHWFSLVEVDLDATEDYARFGALASYEQISEAERRISQAELELYGDGTGAYAGIVARMLRQEDATQAMSEAFGVFEAEAGAAIAQIGVRVGENEASITATATELGSRIDLKADRTYVQSLLADEVSAIRSEIGQLTGGTVQASHLYTQNLTATNTVRLAGYTCSWKTQKVVTSISFSKEQITIPGGNGISYVAIGGVSMTYNTAEIKYLGRD